MSSSYPGKIPEWLGYNKSFVTDVFPSLPQPWYMAERRVLAKEGGKTTLVLTCLDPRCVPETFFGPGFDGGVIRNAGGRATDDAVRSLTLLRGLAGLRNVVVIHHTDCGVMHVTHKEVVDTVAAEGPGAKRAAEEIDYKLFSSDEFEESVRQDVRLLRSAETLAGVDVFGFKLDTFTGKIEPVEV
ncbi:putative carbonic anhydrase [Diaporthe ampelina]|uniref:Carbonic anhydrase n=1 Tax=Diaporthe ampelina TaxID=1214573 RepID=A0A0G2FDS2_9PEZI|nr:putative carbonic anhydrase [Diaporthe ampelina]